LLINHRKAGTAVTQHTATGDLGVEEEGVITSVRFHVDEADQIIGSRSRAAKSASVVSSPSLCRQAGDLAAQFLSLRLGPP
jgi:hypothetical protein